MKKSPVLTQKRTISKTKPRDLRTQIRLPPRIDTRRRASQTGKISASSILISKRGPSMTTLTSLTMRNYPSSKTLTARRIGRTIQRVWPLAHAPKVTYFAFEVRLYRCSKLPTKKSKCRSRSTLRCYLGSSSALLVIRATKRSSRQICSRRGNVGRMTVV